jgi:hypothetical protein
MMGIGKLIADYRILMGIGKLIGAWDIDGDP